jgi:hypothetical protein
VLAPFELSIPQFTTSSVLRRRPGLSNAQLARRALILPQSMIQVIAVTYEKGNCPACSREANHYHSEAVYDIMCGRRVIVRIAHIDG